MSITATFIIYALLYDVLLQINVDILAKLPAISTFITLVFIIIIMAFPWILCVQYMPPPNHYNWWLIFNAAVDSVTVLQISSKRVLLLRSNWQSFEMVLVPVGNYNWRLNWLTGWRILRVEDPL